MHIWEKEQITTRELLTSGWNFFRQHMVFFMCVGISKDIILSNNPVVGFPFFVTVFYWCISRMFVFMLPVVIFRTIINEHDLVGPLIKCVRQCWFRLFIVMVILNCVGSVLPYLGWWTYKIVVRLIGAMLIFCTMVIIFQNKSISNVLRYTYEMTKKRWRLVLKIGVVLFYVLDGIVMPIPFFLAKSIGNIFMPSNLVRSIADIIDHLSRGFIDVYIMIVTTILVLHLMHVKEFAGAENMEEKDSCDHEP